MDQAESIEFNPDDPFSIGIFGGPTTGKTTIVSTFPKPILMLVCSGGVKKPGELRSIAKADREHIKQIRIESSDQFANICEELESDNTFATVALDHLSSFSDLVLAEILGINRVKPQLAWGDVEQQQWQKHGSLIKEHLRRLIELDKHSAIICHERLFEPKDEDSIVPTKIGPAVTPTIAAWLTGTLDYMIQTFVREQTKTVTRKIGKKTKQSEVKTGESEFCAYLPYDEHRMTKFRKPRGEKVDKVLVDVTYEKLVAAMGE